MQTMYGLAGERQLREWEIDWLPGYEQSRPVRIGNAAHEQLQIDVFGEVMDALHQARRGGIDFDASEWAFQKALLEHLEQIWMQPDEGMWEVRGGRAAFHLLESHGVGGLRSRREERRGVRSRRSGRSLAGDAAADSRRHLRPRLRSRARLLRAGIRVEGARREPAAVAVDRFLPASDPRVKGTIEAIERDLLCDGFVMRYDTATTDDGLPPGEGAFLACSFWLADAYVMLGRVDEARALFERLLALRNDVGLLAEEYDTRARRQVGNFPQAFSHIALDQHRA